MKKLLLIPALLCTVALHAQFNQDAPWMEQINAQKAKSSKPITFKEIVDAFDSYWETRDKDVKGNGYKPFKRWENHWKNYIKEDGTLPSAAEIWQITVDAKKNETFKNNADASNWISLGLSNFANRSTSSANIGRVNAIAVDPNNPNTYYAGAPAGGIWKSVDAGSTWTPFGDALPQIGVSGIAIDYNNSDIIYVASGDDDAGDTSSVGVLKSTNGGVTWSTTGLNTLNSPSSMNDIYVSPNDSNTLWVATNNGVYKTIDGGTTWSNNNGLQGLNIKDIKVKPGEPNTIYAVSKNTFYISTNGGNSFSSSSTGLPISSNRFVIDVTPNNNNVVYILSSAPDNSFQGLYKSVDSGATFTEVASNATVGDVFDGSTQAWYDLALAVSSSDENEVYIGTLNIWKSTNGGTSFSKINTWYIRDASYTHADIHLLRFFNGTLFAGTDGGFFKSTDNGNSFFDLSTGMEISQFYRISVSKKTSNKIAGGSQDNGGFGYANNQWNNYHGGDGMEAAIDPNNDNLYYGFLYYGQILYISSNSGQDESYSSSIEVSGPESGEWITPLAINSESEVYAGFNSLYKLCGTNWQLVSQPFGENADILEIDDLNPDIIYVASGGNRPLAYANSGSTLWKSTDRGITFTNIGTFSPAITSIEINHNDSNIIYITTVGINGKVMRSNDGGLTFSDDITGSLPSVTKNIIKHQGLHSQNPLFLGTNIGVYRYDDTVGDWELFDNNLPNVPVADLAINLVDGNITAGTYGRGVWQSSIPTESLSDEISLEEIQNVNQSISCSSLDTAKILVKNLGSNTINSINIQAGVNGNTNNSVWNGTLAQNATALIDIPSLPIANSGVQKLQVTATINNDTFASNNTLSSVFYANTTEAVNVVNDFETVNEELITFNEGNTDSCSGYWERGIPSGTLLNTASSGTSVYATNLSGNYADNLKNYLVSECYNLSILANPVLKFNMAFDLEENWDIVYVEYSTDSGLTWNILGSATDLNWYNSDRTNASSGAANDCQNCPGAQWTGTEATLQQYSHSLAALNSETNVIFRFVFHSDELVNQEGVVIDDLVVEGTTLATPSFDETDIAIYPNPSKNIFNLKTKTIFNFDYSVTDITGKIILQHKNVDIKQNLYQLDLGAFSPGIYFLNITSNGGKLSKKLVLN